MLGGQLWGDGVRGYGDTFTVGSAPSLCIPGGGFEWDDDFPLMPVKPSLVASLPGTPAEPPAAVPALVPAQKQVLPLQFSRFTVSPAPVSRFSITHVSDSDMDSIGGESGVLLCEHPALWSCRVPVSICALSLFPVGTATPAKGRVSHVGPGPSHGSFCSLQAAARTVTGSDGPGQSRHCPGTGAAQDGGAGAGAAPGLPDPSRQFLGRFYRKELVCCFEWERGRRGPRGARRWVTVTAVRVCGCL